MRRPPRWSGLPAPLRCFYPASARALFACHRSRRPGRRTRPWLPGAGPIRGRKGGCLPRGLFHGLGNMARHIPGPFVRRCSTIRKEWWFSSRMVLSWTEVKALLASSSVELRSSRLRMPERMPVIKRILNCCRWRLPFRARASISSGATSTLSVSGSRETAGRSWISSISIKELWGY
jgi:hypothetical protein